MKLSDFIQGGGAAAAPGELKLFVTANGAAPEGYSRVSGMVAPTTLYDQVRFTVRPNNTAFAATSENKGWTLTSVFDINTGATTNIANAPTSTTNSVGAMIASDDGFITFFGAASIPGNLTMRYTASTNSWSQLTSSPVSRREPCIAEMQDGQILIFGGSLSSTINAGNITNTVLRFNPAANTWAYGASMPTRTYGGKTCRLPDGRIFFYVPPGYSSNDGSTSVSTARAFIYAPVTDSWQEVDAPPAGAGTTSQPYALDDGRVVLAYTVNANSQVFNPASAPGSQWSAYPITGPGGSNASFASALLFSKPMLGAFLPCTSTIGLLLWTGGAIAPSANVFYAVKD